VSDLLIISINFFVVGEVRNTVDEIVHGRMDQIMHHVATSRMPVNIAFLVFPESIARSVEVPMETLVDERV
jgi:hypothetical protein